MKTIHESANGVEFDVVIASDFRFPGGTSHSVAEEIAAQTAAGYRTALAHLNGPLLQTLRPFNPLIRAHVEDGAAHLLLGEQPVRTRLLVIRHPATAQYSMNQLPPIRPDLVVIVANAGPHNIDGRVHYDPQLVTEVVRKRFALDPLWAPIGPLVRREIIRTVDPGQMLPSDWVNIIDADQWAAPRPMRSARPVIGRHSRPSAQKWPESARVLQQVYPADGSWEVRILGGAQPVERLLGAIPESWTVLPFGAVAPKEFLAGLDFFVYFHDTRWVEAFGRTILEAIATGVPAVLPPHFEELFGPAALYAEPSNVRALVERYWRDEDRYTEHVHQAQSVVRERFSHQTHVARLNELLGTPAPSTDSPRAEPLRTVTALTTRPRTVPRVLFCSSNGAGMGHLTRLLAYARRLDSRAEPYFLSLSQAVPVVAQYGYPYEYLPSAKALGMPTGRWQWMFIDRVADCLTRIRPDVVVFDGTWPYHGVPKLREVNPHAHWIWSRRGMWRPGANKEQLDKAAWFDLVIEPGDFAADYDRGVTTTAPAERVPPVTLLDRDERDDRNTARRHLGLPAEGPLALVSLGAGNINDPTHDIGAITIALQKLGVGVCVTHPEIATSDHGDEGVHIVHDYPLARRYSAFDLVVSASGYNSYQELLRMGLPTLFVPNTETALDDQSARARFARDHGWAHMLTEVSVENATPLLADLLGRGEQMASLALTADPGNGAHAASQLILDLATTRQGAVIA